MDRTASSMRASVVFSSPSNSEESVLGCIHTEFIPEDKRDRRSYRAEPGSPGFGAAEDQSPSSMTSMAEMVAKFLIGSKVRSSFPSVEGRM